MALALVMVSSLCLSAANAVTDALGGKELRGVFVDTFENRDFPSKPGLSEAAMKAELDGIVAFAADKKLNTIFFKVCAAGGALYQSQVFPASFYLTGKQGASIGFDPLAYLVTSAKSRGLRVQAWIDPVRAAPGSPQAQGAASLQKYVDTTQSYLPPQLASSQGGAELPDKDSEQASLSRHPQYLINGLDGSMYYDLANPEARRLFADAAAELLANYGISGIHLDSDVYEYDLDDSKAYTAYGGTRSIEEFRRDNVTALISEVAARVKSAKASAFFGVTATGTAYSLDNEYDTGTWIAQELTDYLVPKLYTAIGYGVTDFKAQLEGWKNATYGTPVLLMPALNSAAVGVESVDGGSYMDPAELMYQIMMARSSYSDGHVFSDSTSLMKNPLDMFSKLNRIYLDDTVSVRNTSFTPSTKLAVTRPSDDITVTGDGYFIMGTSNPKQDLYVNGELVTERGPGGTFGVLIKTPAGKTEVTVTQGSSVINRVLSRSVSSGVTKISRITQSSMLPTSMGIIKSGQSYEVKCVAPSGATVTAAVDGNTCTLTQVAATAESGVPATYKGTLTIRGDYTESETTNLGRITYKLSYEGNTTTFDSNGDLFYIGGSTTPSARMNDDVTLIFKSTSSSAGTLTNLRKDTTDYIVDETDTMFKLSMGGYVRKSDVTLVAGPTLPKAKTSGATYEKGADSEAYVIKNGANIPFVFSREDSSLSVSLYNLEGLSKIDVSKSILFDSCTVSGGKATFQLRGGAVLGGYSLYYRGSDAVLYFKRAPSRRSGDRPLEGVTVVLDPGHGGSDPGALGPTGSTIMEEDITLAVSQRARSYLQDLGATVYLTRVSDNGATLSDRVGLGERVRPDFFVSVHINSAAETANTNKSTGVEIYYYTGASSGLANNLLTQLATATGRKARGAYRSTYVVTRTYYAPSVLCELGFMPNPTEFEDMISASDIDRSGFAIAQGILHSI